MLFKTRKSWLVRLALVLVLVGALFGVLPAVTVQATTLIVTNTNDSGAGSLRQAILDATSGDSIRFDPSLAGQTIALTSQIGVDKELSIDGSGLNPAVEISGSPASRIFYVSHNGVLTLDAVLVKNGHDSSGGNGGAIYNEGSLTVRNSTFINNSTTGHGGAIYSIATLDIESSTFLSNRAFSGGAVYMDGGIFVNPASTRAIVNSTFVSNQADTFNGQGGGVFSNGNGSDYMNGNIPVFVNDTFSGNGASEGGGLYSLGNLSFRNNIFANSTSGGDCVNFSMPGGTITGSHNLISDGVPCSSDPFVSGDPLLGPLDDNGGPTQTMALLPGSPAIDAGTATCVSADQRGIARPQGAACDIGAYEYEYQPVTYYVKSDATGANNGTSWTDAYTDLQSALAAASSGDQIWVAGGVYKPTTSADRAISFVLKNGVAIYGSFAGAETYLTERHIGTNLTVLSGDIGAPGIDDDNSYHVVIGSHTNSYARVDGFTVTGGNANSSPYDKGGGMYNDQGNPSLTNMIFSGNYATFGGGMYNGGDGNPQNGSSPDLTNVIFRDNSAIEGGGLRNENYSRPRLMNVSFSGNTAVRSGGGIENFNYSNPIMTNVTFDGNTAGAGGGMMNWSYSSPMLINATFHGNSATDEGGALYNDNGSSPWVMNTTFSGNSAAQGGGTYNAYGSNPSFNSSILYGNFGGEIFDVSGTRTVTYSIVQGGYPGIGNLNADPLLGPLQNNGGFTQTMALGVGSAAIDAADLASCPSTDQRGVARPQGSGCDMGSFEYVAPITPTPIITVTYTPTVTPTSTYTPTITVTPTQTPKHGKPPVPTKTAVPTRTPRK